MRFRDYGRLNFFSKMAASRHLGFDQIGIVPFDPPTAVPENPTLEPKKREVVGMTRCRVIDIFEIIQSV